LTPESKKPNRIIEPIRQIDTQTLQGVTRLRTS